MKRITVLLTFLLLGCYSTSSDPSVRTMDHERYSSVSWRAEISGNIAKIFILKDEVESVWQCEYGTNYVLSRCVKIK